MDSLLERPNLIYTNQSSKFHSTASDYFHQYFNIYVKRLEQFRDILNARVMLKWDDMYPIVKLSDLGESHYDSCVIIGTIFKDQTLKPSVLKQFAEAEQLVPQPVFTGKYATDDSDRLFIEDEGHRYQLDGNIEASRLVTGVTVAVLGSETDLHKFKVEDYCFAGLNNHIDRPLFNNEDFYIIFLSGLDIAHSLDAMLPLNVLMQWLSGGLGDLNGVDVSKVCRVVIVGNSISTKSDLQARKLVKNDKQLDNVKALDRLLLDAVQVVDVDLMPGENDPTSYILPQRPIHYCMLPLSAPYRSMNCVSNPYAFTIGEQNNGTEGLRFLGTSGSPVRDVMRYSGGLKTGLIAMEECLKWGHLAPTAPDTLGCYPFSDSDPFIIDKAPHVFFTGNQEEFETKMCQFDGKDVRLIAIPEFSQTREVCVLNLTNLDCFTICFDVIV